MHATAYGCNGRAGGWLYYLKALLRLYYLKALLRLQSEPLSHNRGCSLYEGLNRGGALIEAAASIKAEGPLLKAIGASALIEAAASIKGALFGLS